MREGLIGVCNPSLTAAGSAEVLVAKEVPHSPWKGNDPAATFPPTLIGRCYLLHL